MYYIIIVSTFFGIRYPCWGHAPRCRAWVSKFFDYYVLDFAESGSLELRVGDAPMRQLKGPVAWLTYPGSHFQFGKRGGDAGTWEHRYVAFSGAFGDELARKGIFTVDAPIIPIHNLNRFTMAFDELLAYLDNPVWGMDRAAIMLEGLILQLHEQELQQRFEKMDARIKGLVAGVRQDPAKEWDFAQEAGRLGLSNSHFRKLFHDGMNQPPTLFLIGERMKRAARMLREEASTLTEIAERCGYEDIYFFNKTFKKHHGVSPGRYRRQAMGLG